MKKDPLLWTKLKQFSFDDPEADFSFSARLARENGWTLEYSRRVIEEYRKFLYLCCVENEPVTPSDEVDQAWHLHLCYTRSYWNDLCQDTLGTEIHHGPTKGGKCERAKFADWYSRTLSAYQREFDTPPPEAVWPSPGKRFRSIRFERIDRGSNWIIPKRAGAAAVAASVLAMLVAGCEGNVFLGDDIGWVVIVAALVLGFVIMIAAFTKGGGGKGGHGCGGGGGCGGAGCGTDTGCGGGGGCGGCGS